MRKFFLWSGPQSNTISKSGGDHFRFEHNSTKADTGCLPEKLNNFKWKKRCRRKTKCIWDEIPRKDLEEKDLIDKLNVNVLLGKLTSTDPYKYSLLLMHISNNNEIELLSDNNDSCK